MELRILGATCEFFDRIVFQWVNAAEAPQAIGKARNLSAGPIVLGFDLGILVFDGWLVGSAELIGDRQHQGSANCSRVQKRDQITCVDRLKPWGQFRDSRTKEVLVVVHKRQ